MWAWPGLGRVMPDPGEVGPSAHADLLPSAAGRIGADVVHLVERSTVGFVWHTVCPADVDGLRVGVPARDVVLTLEVIDCRACFACREAEAAVVNAANSRVRRQHDRDADAVLRFLAWARASADVDFVPSAYAGGPRLFALPSQVADAVVGRWLRSRAA